VTAAGKAAQSQFVQKKLLVHRFAIAEAFEVLSILWRSPQIRQTKPKFRLLKES
jgi:hypothetical protein